MLANRYRETQDPEIIETNYGLMTPAWSAPLYDTDQRYVALYGGRGSGKSWAIATFLINEACNNPIRVLCCRETQNSMDQSTYRLLVSRIRDAGLMNDFHTTYRTIKHKVTGAEFFFYGLKHNPAAIQSTEGINYAWVSEAQVITADSMMILTPTVRENESKIIMDFNPRFIGDWTSENFIENIRPDAEVINVNWDKNPFFNDVMRSEKDVLYDLNPAAAAHVWGGAYRVQGGRPVFRKSQLCRYRPGLSDNEWNGGLDLSWSGDNALVNIRIGADEELYISDARYITHLSIQEMPGWIGEFPGTMVIDSARPEMIDYLRSEDYSCKGSRKGAGSVINGLDKLARYPMIHICEGPGGDKLFEEFCMLSWDDDDNPTGKDDGIDAVRYAHELIDSQMKVISWADFQDRGVRIA